MANLNDYVFYLKDPQISIEDIYKSLKQLLPSKKSQLRNNLYSIGTPDKYKQYIQVDKNFLQALEIHISTENIVTVMPKLGNGIFGFLLGFWEFAILDPKFTAQVGSELYKIHGATELVKCPQCELQYPAYTEKCSKCNREFVTNTVTTKNHLDRDDSNVPPIPESKKSNNDKTMEDEYIHPERIKKSALSATIRSLFFFGGGGQIYLGQTKKGMIIIAVTIITLFLGIGAIIWVFGIIDAYIVGKKLESGKAVGEMEFL